MGWWLKVDRPQLDHKELLAAAAEMAQAAKVRADTDKGWGVFVNALEARGVIEEEFEELADEIRDHNLDGIEHELEDLAVAVLWAMASLRKFRQEKEDR